MAPLPHFNLYMDHFNAYHEAHPILVPSISLLVFLILFVLVNYSDGRALGTTKRKDLELAQDGWPIVGHLFAVLGNSHRQMEYFIDLRSRKKDKSKALTITVPGRRVIDVTNPEHIEYVQKTNFGNFVKGKMFRENMYDILGDGIFAVDGEKWTIQRKATAKIFTANNFRGVISHSIENNLNKLKKIIGRHADKGEEFDLMALFFAFTLESFGEMAFGQTIGALSDETDAPVPFAVAFDKAQNIINRRFINPLWRIFQRFNGEQAVMNHSLKVLDDFTYKIIDERVRQGADNYISDDKGKSVPSKPENSKDLLSLYVAIRDDKGQPMTRRALRDAVLNLIIAGRDTTAQTLSWTFSRLLFQPSLIEPIRAEIDETNMVDYDSFKNMTQTLAAIHEGLRLHPAVPKNGWEALNHDQLPNGGPKIEPGDIVRWSDWEMGRMTSVWGEDASEYKPSRWIDESGHLKKESQWKAHYFNGGARLCLGMNLALYEATTVMATIIRDFDLEFAPGYRENLTYCEIDKTSPAYQSSLTLPMAAPFMVKATRRKS